MREDLSSSQESEHRYADRNRAKLQHVIVLKVTGAWIAVDEGVSRNVETVISGWTHVDSALLRRENSDFYIASSIRSDQQIVFADCTVLNGAVRIVVSELQPESLFFTSTLTL